MPKTDESGFEYLDKMIQQGLKEQSGMTESSASSTTPKGLFPEQTQASGAQDSLEPFGPKEQEELMRRIARSSGSRVRTRIRTERNGG